MEHDISKEIPKAGKDTDAQDSHVQAVAEGSQDSFPDVMFPSVRLGPCHCRQQDHCHGIGNGRWKKDKGKCHSCQNTVELKSFPGSKTGEDQTAGNPDGLCTGEQV